MVAFNQHTAVKGKSFLLYQ